MYKWLVAVVTSVCLLAGTSWTAFGQNPPKTKRKTNTTSSKSSSSSSSAAAARREQERRARLAAEKKARARKARLAAERKDRERKARLAAERKRKATAAAERKRKAAAAAERKRKAAVAAERKRKAELAAERKRKAVAAERKRKAGLAAERKRKAAAAAERKRKATAATERKRKAELAATKERERKAKLDVARKRKARLEAEKKARERKPKLADTKKGKPNPKLADTKKGKPNPKLADTKKGKPNPKLADTKKGERKPKLADTKKGKRNPKLTDKKGDRKPKLTEKKKQKPLAITAKEKERRSRLAAAAAKQRRERDKRVKRLTNAQKTRLKRLHTLDLERRNKARRPVTLAKKPAPTKRLVPVKRLPVLALTGGTKAALAKVGTNNPKVQTALNKLQNKQRLSKTDLAGLKTALQKTRDPKAAAALRKLVKFSPYVSNQSLQKLNALKNSNALTPGEKGILDRFLKGETLSASELAIAKNLLDRPGIKNNGSAVAALSQMIREAQHDKQREDFLKAMQQMSGGMPTDGGGMCGGGGGGGMDPMCPSNWVPTDPNADPGPDAVPEGNGLCSTVSPGPDEPVVDPTGSGEGGEGGEGGQGEGGQGEGNGNKGSNADGGKGTEPVKDLGSVALDDPVVQKARYLRIANATDERITVWVQYRAQKEGGNWDWFPAAPGEAGETVSYELNPGEVVDVADHDWRINASRVRFWAKSPTKEWVNFKDKDLWLVPETDADGGHSYNAPEMQTFNLTVR